VPSLLTVGARKGEPRRSTLDYFGESDRQWLIVAAGGGSVHHPNWFFNLAKHPDRVWVEIGRRHTMKMRPPTLQGEERARAWC
jgi:deazaflavin-dependent oxidoreductase (nitroreductase family)